jgi:hypothetical protein
MANKKTAVDYVRTGIEEITTQGDLLYRGATDLERLPKGTSGQTLKMGSSNEPEWATVASPASPSWTTKSSGTFSAVSSFEATNLTKTTQVILYNLNVNSSYERIHGRVSNDNGSSWQSSASTYQYISKYTHLPPNSSISDSYQYSNGDTEMRIAAGAVGSGVTDASVVKVTIYDPANTSKNKMFELYTFESSKSASGYIVSIGNGVFVGNTSAIDAIQLYSSGSGKTITGSYKVLELN